MAHERTTFFTIDRKLLEDPYWLSEPFTKPQAWVDLIGLANYRNLKRMEGDQMKIYKRGQVVSSVRTLAERWKWSQEKVRNFLKALESDRMASTKKSAKGVVITLENYAFYQDVQQPKRAANRELTEHSPSTHRAETEHSPRQKNKENNDNKENNMREGLRPWGPSGRLSLTVEEVKKFRDLYPEAADRFIEELDAYKGATGKTYVNDYAALIRWAKKDADYGRRKEERTREPGKGFGFGPKVEEDDV